MEFTAKGKTLFILDEESQSLTLTTWEGGEATLPLSDVLSFVAHLIETAPQLQVSEMLLQQSPRSSSFGDH